MKHFHRFRGSWLWVALLVAAGVPQGLGQAPLRTLAEIHRLSNDQAAAHLPVRFEATVTYYRSYERTLFVQDGEVAIYVQPASPVDIVPGDRVRIEGITERSFRPIINEARIQVLSHGSLPHPVPATYAEMVKVEFDCRYVTVRGQVRSAQQILSTGRPTTVLELFTEGGLVEVTIDDVNTERTDHLLDSMVEVDGAQSGRFNGRMEETGMLIHTESLDQVRLVASAHADPWTLPLTGMNEVLKGFHQVDNSERVRLEGTLTYYYPGEMAILQNGTQSILVSTPEISPLHVGDRAEAIGLPLVRDDFLTLRLGSIRTHGPAPVLKPERVDWDAIATAKYPFNLVTIEGVIVAQVREQDEDVYMVSSGKHLFSARLRHPYVYDWNASHTPPPARSVPVGSRVDVTGIVQLELGNPFSGPVAFNIRLRTADDIAILDTPSWWTVRHLAYIAFILLGMFLITGVWVGLLNRKVRRQTAALTRTIEAEAAQERQNAQIENKRSQILEQISLGEPLAYILERITELVSSRLNGVACWCQVQGGAQLGSPIEDPSHFSILRAEIPSRSGATLGTLSVALPLGAEASAFCYEALHAGARLATLAIETRALYSDLVHRSEFDLLTDVPNRFALEKQLALMIEEARANAGNVGLIYLDLDGFKKVNDLFGHRTGDLYLMEAARRMRHQLRSQDVLARLGGDEFAVIVPSVHTREQVLEIAHRLNHCFLEPFQIEQRMLRGAVSAGVAIYPADGATTDALLRSADAAMYTQKRAKKIAAIEDVEDDGVRG